MLTEEDGSFRAGGRFIVLHPEYERVGVRVKETFELEKCKTLAGTVIDLNGKPIPECSVQFRKVASYEFDKFTKTDAAGRFSICLTVAEIRANNLEIQKNGYQVERVETESTWDQPLLVTLKPANNSERVVSEQANTIQECQVAGKVVCGPSEIKDMRVQLRSEREISLRRSWLACPCSNETKPDASGRFVFPNMEAGQYELSVEWKNQVLCRRPVIVSGKNLELASIRLPERGTVRGSLKANAARGSAFEELWISDVYKTKAIQVFANQDGDFLLQDLLPGRWFVGDNMARQLNEAIVMSNKTTRCRFAIDNGLAIEVPYHSEDLIRPRLTPRTEVLLVGDPQSQILRTSFARKGESYAELLSQEGNKRLIKTTLVRGECSEVVIRELVLEEGVPVQRWKESETKVVAISNAPVDQADSETTIYGVTTYSFVQNGTETNRIVAGGLDSSMIASGNYHLFVHNHSGWAKLKVTVPSKSGVADLGPIQLQPGGKIAGRVSLADKLCYPTSLRVTSEEGFELQQTLEGKHEESYSFRGLWPGKWTVSLLDERQPTHLSVLKIEPVEVVGVQTTTVDF